MKKCLILTLACVLALTMLAGCSGGNTSSGGNTVKIGVFEPQSGDNGAGGKQEALGVQYANSLTPTVDIGRQDL